MRPVFDVVDSMSVQNRLKLLQMPPARRRRLLSQLGRQVRVNSRRRLRTQTDMNGQPFKERASKSRKRMLMGLSKRMHVKASDTSVEIGFSGVVGQIARKQQDGIDEVMTAEKAQKIHGQPDYDAPATRDQAKALRMEGYRARKPSGKGYRNISIREIMNTMTLGQAGVILRHMRDQVGKKSWVIPLPARSFLGATKSEVDKLADILITELTGSS